MSDTRPPLRDRLLEALVAAVEHGCQVTKAQLDGRNWNSADRAANVTDALVETFLRVTAREALGG